MTDVINFTKQAFTWTVVALTVAWSVGLSALVAPVAANAAECTAVSAGDLVKFGTSPAVYVVDEDMGLHSFTNPAQLESWGVTYDDIVPQPATCISEFDVIPAGPAGRGYSYGLLTSSIGNGVVYFLTLDGSAYTVQSPADAMTLWGEGWESAIRLFSSLEGPNYPGLQSATPLDVNNLPNEVLISYNGVVWVHRDGSVYPIEGDVNDFVRARAIIGTDEMIGEFTVMEDTIPTADLFNIVRGFDGETTTTPGTETPVADGDLTVSLAASTPESASVPAGATRVEVATFKLNGTGTVDSLKFRRSGVGAPGEIANVYLYEGNTRLTTARSLNSSSQEVTFSGLDMDISGSRNVTVVVDFADSSVSGYGAHTFELASATSVGSAAAVNGTFPVRGNVMYRADVAAGSVTIAKTGTGVNPSIGEKNVKIAEFRLTAGSVEAIELNSITLFNSGNLSEEDLTNFKLLQGSTVVGTGMAIGNDRILLELDDAYMIDKGQVRTFEVRADISGSARVDDTISIYIEDDADINAVGKVYGFGVAVTNNFGSGASYDTTVEGGDITLTFQGPSKKDVAPDTQDVELLRFTFSTQNNVEVRNTRLKFTSVAANLGTSGDKYRNVRIVNTETGAVLAGPFDINDVAAPLTSLDYVVNDTWDAAAGSSMTLAVVADLGTFAPANGESIQVDLSPFQASDIRNLDNNQYVDHTTAIVPSAAITGNAHTVIAGDLTVTAAGTPSATTVVNGAADVAVTGINLRASDAKDLYVKSLKVTATGATDCATETNCVLSLRLFDGETQVGSAQSLSTDSATFSNINVKVPKGSTKTLTVRVNLNRLSSVAGGTTLTVGVAATADVQAQDVNGNAITVSGTITGPTHTITDGGSLSVANAPITTDTEARLVQGGTEGVLLGQFEFTAQDEALQISKMDAAIPAGAIQEVTALALFDGATQLTPYTSLQVDGAIAFARFTDSSFNESFEVAADSVKTLTVRGNIAAPNTSGIDSGTVVTTTIVTSTFEARGVNSSSNTVIAGGDVTDLGTVVSQPVYVMKSVITASEESLASSLLQNNSGLPLYKLSLTKSGTTAKVSRMTFEVNINSAAGSIGGLQLFRNGTAVTPSTYSFTTTTLTSSTASTAVVFNAASLESVGGTNTYEVRGSLTGFDTSSNSSDTVNLKLTGDSSFVKGTVAAQSAANFVWSDVSAIPNSTTSGDWYTGYLVRSISSFSGFTLSR